MSLHLLKFNKNNIKFKQKTKHTLPPTCDTIVKNLMKNPRQHLSLINNNKSLDLSNRKHPDLPKIKKMGNYLGKDFSVSIPDHAYWKSSQQLVQFLNKTDKLSTHIDGFYVMQPIVVQSNTHKSNTTEWTLFEGQQRITNIYMILKYLESNKTRHPVCKSSSDVLNNYFLKTLHYSCWDNYLQNKPANNSHLSANLGEIYQILHNWFSKKSFVEQELWKKKLLNHTKFIWYMAENELFDSKKVLKTGGVGIQAKYLS